MTRPKQFNREVLIRFSPIVAWKFQINLVGSFSFIVFSIYKMIENQPSRLTAANIWIETWLGKNIQTFGRSKDKHMFQQMELCTKMSHLLKTNAFSLKTYALKILYLLVSSHCFLSSFVFDIIFAQLCCILKIQSVIWLLSFFEV